MSKKIIFASFFLISLLATWQFLPPAKAQNAPAEKPPSKGNAAGSQFVKSVGAVTVDSEQNVITSNETFYTNAHMHTENGATMDCHNLRGDMDKAGGFTQFVATGDVVAHVPFARGQIYDILADKAVYDLADHQIDLTGKTVKVTAQTPYTKGPLVQTGDSGVVLLGPSPNYPKITEFPTILMNNVHTQFTPAQTPAAGASSGPH